MKQERQELSASLLERFAPAAATRESAVFVLACVFSAILLAPALWAAAPMSTPRYDHSATTLLDGKVLLAAGWNGGSLDSAELYDPNSGSTLPSGLLTYGRYNHTATLLKDGKVLFIGGYNSFIGAVPTAEVYDPTTGQFTPVGDLINPRYLHAATLLPDGRVLVTGGYYADALSSAEIFDPATGMFSSAGNMTSARYIHSSVLLPNGKVLLAGGHNGMNSLDTAELFDPVLGTFTPTGAMNVARYYQTTTALAGGKILICGGYNEFSTSLGSAEVYDSATGLFSAAGNMSIPRYLHSATLLASGKVLVAGAVGSCSGALATTELFDPSTGLFSPGANINVARYGHTANLLPGDKVLIAGGYNTDPLASIEELDPAANSNASNQFVMAGAMTEARFGHVATLLANGNVLLSGNSFGNVNSAEIYDSGTRVFRGVGNMSAGRFMHSSSLLQDGKVLVTGGYLIDPGQSAELFDPTSETFLPAGNLLTVRAEHTGTTLANGKVLVAGGKNDSSILASAEIYDPSLKQFSATGDMTVERYEHTATLLADGRVLIVGGASSGGPLGSAELFDPSTGVFTPVGSLQDARYYHRATLLADGKVLITGGVGNSGFVASGEIYDPTTQTFATTASLITARYLHSSTLISGGKVLIAGGYGGAFLGSTEIFDPATGQFQPGPSLGFARYLHTATGLRDGNVLVAGGYGDCGYLASAELYIAPGQSADTTPPVITGPGNLLMEATGTAGAIVNFTASANDNVDGTVPVLRNYPSGSTFPIGRTTVLLTATDHAGNAATSSFDIVVRDTTSPAIGILADITVEAVNGNGAVVTFTAHANDIVDGPLNVSASPASGSTFPLGATKVLLTATDSHGNSSAREFNIAVRDSTAPVLTLPGPIVAEATSAKGASVSFTVSATDAVDPNPAVLTAFPSPSQFPLGVTSVQVLAGDASGNTSEGEFTVTVQDTTAPHITAPANVIAEATSNAGATVSFSASAFDLVDGPVTPSTDPASGTVFPIGATVVNLSASDKAGNTSSSSFTVTVQDTTAPTIAPHENLVAEAQGPQGAPVNFSLSATDLVDQSVTVRASPASGSTFPLGKTVVHLSSTDAHGNSASSEFTVTVQDTSAPALQLPDKIVAEAQNSSGSTASFNVAALDLVDGAVEATASQASGSVFPIGLNTVTVTAKDKTGNVAERKFDVLVQDTTAPLLQLPANIVAEATGPNGASVSFSLGAKDSVDGAVTPLASPLSGSTFPIGTTLVNVVATDSHGNSARGYFSVTVRDTKAPQIEIPQNILLEATSGSGAVAAFTTRAIDLVDGTVQVSSSASSGSTFSLGTTTVLLTATDSHGNKAEASFTITVRDTTPPSITCPADISLDGKDNPVVNYEATVSDVVDPTPRVVYSPASGSTFPIGVTTVTVTATDASGNTSTCSFRVGRAEHGKFKFKGFLDPISGANTTGGSPASPVATFKYGATIPVSFTLTQDSQPVTTGVQTFQMSPYDSKKGHKKNAVISGNFRYEKGQWQYNLQTKHPKIEKGIWQLTSILSDGTQYNAWIKLK